MLRSIIVTGLVIASSAAFSAPFSPTPDARNVHKYTFGGSCDGISLNQSSASGTARGHHTGGCEDNQYAGGVKAVIGGKNVWIIQTTNSDDSGTDMYLLDEAALTWKLYEQINGEVKFNEFSSGALVVGAPPELKRRASGTPMKASNDAAAKK
jgi:hypothetical protein